MAKLENRLDDLSVKLNDLSKDAANAAEEVRVAKELRREEIEDKISTAKGNAAAFQEKIRIADEERKSKLASELLKAKMTLEYKIKDIKDAVDTARFENYVDDQVDYILDHFDAAAFLIAEAKLAILETIQAAAAFEEKHPQE